MASKEVTSVAISKGTSLIAVALSEGAVVAADALLYGVKDGVAVPTHKDFKKVFASDNIIIASAATMIYKRAGTFAFEYEFENWISEFISLQTGAPDKNPTAIAEAICDKVRKTFKPIEARIKAGDWSAQGPGERLVTYVVAGYAENFKHFRLFEIGVEINAEGNGLAPVAPKRHHAEFPQNLFFGEDEFIQRAMNGVRPMRNVWETRQAACLDELNSNCGDIPKALRDAAASIVGLIQVEAQFNPKRVGGTVNVGLIDRVASKTYSITL